MDFLHCQNTLNELITYNKCNLLHLFFHVFTGSGFRVLSLAKEETILNVKWDDHKFNIMVLFKLRVSLNFTLLREVCGTQLLPSGHFA